MMDPQRHSYNPFDVSTWLGEDSARTKIPSRGLPTHNNFHSTPQESTTTLFVGDLAVLCDEGKLFELFYPFGEIDSVQLKKSDRDPLRSHLGFGFVKFKNHENAERALQALNGHFLLGRAMRVGWAEDYGKRQNNSTIEKTIDPKKQRQTAQIHVTFTSRDLTKMVSEMELGKVFQRFGNLVDIAIKRNVVNEVLQTQSGYAFIHFTLNSDGIQSAITAVEAVNNCVIDNIVYQVKVTHTLQAQILTMTNRRGMSQRPRPIEEFETYAKTNDQRTVPLTSPVQRFNGILPPQQLVHAFPNDLPQSMNLRSQSLDSFSERYHKMSNHGGMMLESLPVGHYSFEAHRPDNLMKQVPSTSVRPNPFSPSTLRGEFTTSSRNLSAGSQIPSFPQQSSFERF